MEIPNEFPKRPALDTIFEEEFTPNERIIKALNKIEVISRNFWIFLDFTNFLKIILGSWTLCWGQNSVQNIPLPKGEAFSKTNQSSLCSRNFQNVKLRLDFVEIWSFYHHFLILREIQFWWIQTVKKCHLAILKVLNLDF